MHGSKTIEDEIQAVVEPLRDKAEEVVVDARRRLAPIDEWVRTMAREQPMVALGGAVLVGYLVGRLIRRRAP